MTAGDSDSNPFAAPRSPDVTLEDAEVHRGIPVLLIVGIVLYGGFTLLLLQSGNKDAEVGRKFLIVLACLILGAISGGFNYRWLPWSMLVALLIQIAVIAWFTFENGMPHESGMITFAVILSSMVFIGVYYAVRNRLRLLRRRRPTAAGRIFQSR